MRSEDIEMDCPACNDHRLHFGREFEQHHPELWRKLTPTQKAEMLSPAHNPSALMVYRTTEPDAFHFIDPKTGLDAYGLYTVDGDQPEGALTSAPSQEAMDRIAALIDAIPDALFGQMLAVARAEGY